MLRKSPTRRLYWWWRRRERREVRGAPRWRRWRAGGFRHNAHIAVVMGAWCRRRRIRLTIVAILQAGGRRTGRMLCGSPITVIAVRFARIIRVRLITNVRWAGCWRWRLIDDLVVPVRATRSGCWRRWWIDWIRHHTATICRWAWGACDMIAIVGIHAVARVQRRHAYCIRNWSDFGNPLRFAQRRRWQWISGLIILRLRSTLSNTRAAELQQIDNRKYGYHRSANQNHKGTFVGCRCHAALQADIRGFISSIGAVLPAIAEQCGRDAELKDFQMS